MYKIVSLFLFTLICLSNPDKPLNEDLTPELEYLKSNIDYPLGKTFNIFNKTFVGETNVSFWFRNTIQNETNTKVDYKLVLKTLSYDTLKIFTLKDKKLQLIYNYRNTKQKELSIPIVLDAKTSQTIYYKVHFTKSVYFPVSLRTEESHSKITSIDLIKNSMYYGFVLVVILINLFFFKQTKDLFFIYYVLMVLGITLILLEMDGVFYHFFKGALILPFLDIIFRFLSVVFEALFINKALELSKNKYYNKIGVVLIIFNAIFYILYAVTKDLNFYSIGELFNASVYTYYLILGLIFFKNNIYARFLVIAYSILFIANIFFVIPSEFGGKDIWFDLFYLKIASIIEMAILLYAISYRYKHVETSKEFIEKSYAESLENISDLKTEIQTHQSRVGLEHKVSLEVFKSKYELSQREFEVLSLLVNGNTNKQIAEKIFLSESSIKQYCAKLFDKTNVKNRVQLVALFNNR